METIVLDAELNSFRIDIFKELELKMPVVDSVSCIAKITSNA